MTGSLSPVQLAALIAALRARPEVQDAYLFGSQARDASTQVSDVDVAVYIEPAAAPAPSPFGYAADLSAEFGSAIGRSDVDVVVLNDAGPVLYHRVIAGGDRIFVRDLTAATTREGLALSRYCDYLPQLRIVDEALRRRLASGAFGR